MAGLTHVSNWHALSTVSYAACLFLPANTNSAKRWFSSSPPELFAETWIRVPAESPSHGTAQVLRIQLLLPPKMSVYARSLSIIHHTTAEHH